MRPPRRGRVLAAPAALAVLALAAAAAPAKSEDAAPRLEVRLKPLRAEIGDPVEAELELIVPAGLAVGPPLFPRWEASWGAAEVAAVSAPVGEPAADGAIRYRQSVRLIPWTTGELELPPPTVELPTASEILAVRAPRPAVLEVGSVLPGDGERPAPKPPAPPLPLPVSDAFWWTLAATASACLFAATLLVARRRAAAARAAGVAVDPLTALGEALGRLERLEDPLALIAGLSLALRRYLGRRLGFPAAESTTTEIRRRLQERGLPAALVLAIDELLRRCDAIKFARQPIERAACAGPLAEAASLAARLEEHLRPAPEEAAEVRREAA